MYHVRFPELDLLEESKYIFILLYLRTFTPGGHRF